MLSYQKQNKDHQWSVKKCCRLLDTFVTATEKPMLMGASSPGLRVGKEKPLSSTDVLEQVLEEEYKTGQRVKRPSSRGQFYSHCFLKNHMKSLHVLKSYRNANQNYNKESPR